MTAKFWKWPLSNLILLGLVVGAVLGLVVERNVTDPASLQTLEWWLANVIQPVGRLFIRIIFMIVIPLIFSAIVLGIAEMGDVRKLGRVGLKSVLFTVLLSGTSVVLGLVLVNVFAPGKHLSAETKQELTAKYGGQVSQKVEQGTKKVPLADTLLGLIPQNPLLEAANMTGEERPRRLNASGAIAYLTRPLDIGAVMRLIDERLGAAARQETEARHV